MLNLKKAVIFCGFFAFSVSIYSSSESTGEVFGSKVEVLDIATPASETGAKSKTSESSFDLSDYDSSDEKEESIRTEGVCRIKGSCKTKETTSLDTDDLLRDDIDPHSGKESTKSALKTKGSRSSANYSIDIGFGPILDSGEDKVISLENGKLGYRLLSPTDRMNAITAHSITLSQVEELQKIRFIFSEEGVPRFKELAHQKNAILSKTRNILISADARHQQRINVYTQSIAKASPGVLELNALNLKEENKQLIKFKEELDLHGVTIPYALLYERENYFGQIMTMPRGIDEAKDIIDSTCMAELQLVLVRVEEDLKFIHDALKINAYQIKERHRENLIRETSALDKLSLQQLKSNSLMHLKTCLNASEIGRKDHYNRWVDAKQAIEEIDKKINSGKIYKFWAESAETLKERRAHLATIMLAQYPLWKEKEHAYKLFSDVAKHYKLLVARKEMEALKDVAQAFYKDKNIELSKDARNHDLIKAIERTHRENGAIFKRRYSVCPTALLLLKNMGVLQSESSVMSYAGNHAQQYVFGQLLESLNRLTAIPASYTHLHSLLQQVAYLTESGYLLNQNHDISGALSAKLTCDAVIDYALTVADVGLAVFEGVGEGVVGTYSILTYLGAKGVDVLTFPEKYVPIVQDKFNRAALAVGGFIAERRKDYELVRKGDEASIQEYERRLDKRNKKFAAFVHKLEDVYNNTPFREKVRIASRFLTETALCNVAGGALVEAVELPVTMKFNAISEALKEKFINPGKALSQEVIEITAQTIDKDAALVKNVIEFAQNDTEFLGAIGEEKVSTQITNLIEYLDSNQLADASKIELSQHYSNAKNNVSWKPINNEPIRNIFKNTQKLPGRRGFSDLHLKEGASSADCIKDFHSINVGEIIPLPEGEGFRGKLTDGRTIIARESTDGRFTLEIQENDGSRRKTKIRYGTRKHDE